MTGRPWDFLSAPLSTLETASDPGGEGPRASSVACVSVLVARQAADRAAVRGGGSRVVWAERANPQILAHPELFAETEFLMETRLPHE